ncbi:class I SAM-dependent methyltransferase [Streptomyces sp. enrichment culture]|uniref:class I SAM-dependent methyltransferase n=1 Tax=Streptomyces sp. enrichment culture TaxID=1795815 RepID=UPI003F556859
MQGEQALAINRSYWDAAGEVHGNGADQYYDLDALLSGRDSLSHVEDRAVRAAVGSVRDLDVLHVQCHIGFDTVSLARRGATVTGVDISPVSLGKAREVAARCGVAPSFVEGDANDLGEHLWDRFDLAYATLGVIFFVPDLSAWMRSVGRCLRPGGRLVLVDYHPLHTMFGCRAPLQAVCSYDAAGPFVWEGETTTHARPSVSMPVSRLVTYRHTVGDVVTSAVEAGLTVESLTEHTATDLECEGAAREADGWVRARIGGEPAPLLFSLLAVKAPR